jgi:2-polyprenyl-6-hydroxyphenyl methylase/3-demethylubiquinone-9 3-methyltransferase
MIQATSSPNVDPGEISKFEALAARWWDPNKEFKPLHQINPLRLDYIDEHSPLEGKKVLDVGCGGGILAEAMAAKGATVTGIDLGDAPLSVAKLHAMENELALDYQKISAEDLAQQHPAEFDIITCMELLEHVPDPSSTVVACATMIKPGGTVYFSTINRNPKSWLFAIVGAEYVLNLLPKGTHAYEKFIKPSELHSWCIKAELSVQDLIGMHYNPLSKYYWLAPGVDVNYIARTVRHAE